MEQSIVRKKLLEYLEETKNLKDIKIFRIKHNIIIIRQTLMHDNRRHKKGWLLWISCGQHVDIYHVAVDKYRECLALCVRLCTFCVRSVFCSGTVDSRRALVQLASGRS